MAFHCINCDAICENKKNASRQNRHYPILCRLQDKVREKDDMKPNISILDAIEDLFEGEITKDQLQRFAGCYICKDCHLMLRLAVNKKLEVEQCMSSLHERIDEITSNTRRQYYREHYATHRAGKCWGCMFDFSEVNYSSKAVRHKLSSMLFEEMTIVEGIQTLLEEEAVTLHGLFPKNTYLCKTCYSLMRLVVKHQCHFETLNASFMSKTADDSIIAVLRRGEIPSVVDSLNVEGGEVELFDDHDILCDKVVADSQSNDGGDGNEFKQLDDVTSDKLVLDEDEVADEEHDQDSTKTIKVTRGRRTKRKSSTKMANEGEVAKKRCRLRICLKDKNKTDNGDESEVELAEDYDDVTDVSNEGNTALECAGNNSDAVDNDEGDKKELSDMNIDDSIEDENVKEIHKEGISMDRITDAPDGNVSNDKSELIKESDNAPEGEGLHVCTEIPDQQADTEVINGLSANMNIYKLDSAETSSFTRLDHSSNERDMSSDDWVIYYYPGIAGRAEFIRLIFEEAGVPYRECGETHQRIKQLINQGEMEGYPHFAPPMLKNGDLQVSQTPVICRFLGDEFQMCPETKADKLHAEQINTSCHDYIAEGRLAFHGIYPVGPYLSQKEATQPYIDRFVKERLPLWMKYFERVLKANNGGTGFLYGTKISYTDLALFHVLQATESQFPEAYQSADYMPLLKSFSQRIASRPRIAAYLKSGRRIAFSGDSMM